MEIKIGKSTFPVISVATIPEDGDVLIVFLNNGKFWGQSLCSKKIAPLKNNGGKITWGNKIVRFV